MKRINIRTINGAKSNGHLERRYAQVQNRAAAVFDAWTEFGEGVSLDLIAHMHRLSVDQIKKDLFGVPSDIKMRFGIKSTSKLERTLKKCLKELKQGVNRALVAVSYHVPFSLLCLLEDTHNVKEVASAFLSDIEKKLDVIDRERTAKRIDDSIKEYTNLKLTNRTPLRSVVNQPIFINSTLQEEQSSNGFQCFDYAASAQTKITSFSQKSIKSPMLTQSHLNNDNEQDQLSNTAIEIHQQPLPKRSKKAYHRIDAYLETHLQMNWKIIHTPGCGLNNKNEIGGCKNMCYVNAVIQCFANTASFAQWLLRDVIPDHCK